MSISLKPIATVSNSRNEVIDDYWSAIVSHITLSDQIPSEAFEGIEAFSHLEIIFYMDKVDDKKAIAHYRHPRNDISLPKLGTYAQRNKNRPNKLGLTTVELVSRSGNSIVVKNLDAINGTAILDIKPVMQEFQPKGIIIQPQWTKKIMANYWE
jgi:tRNA-Thr(GGU) m(6)t(6)A37 methyltransferase TsaA